MIHNILEPLKGKLKGKEDELEKAVLELREYAKKDLGETVTELEEAAMMHYKDVLERKVKTGLETANMTSFKAGAKWQKEQMMKEAIDAEVTDIRTYKSENEVDFTLMLEKGIIPYEIGEEVKLIIIKED